MAVKPLPPLGWRDRLDCVLCQEDSNLLAQDRGVSDCHRRLENAVELGRSPGELNRVAESNCAREPARQAGQREPRLQMLCKRLQRHNRHTCGGAAKGSRGGWYRRWCILGIPHRCCTAENCWAKPSTVSPNSPAWEMGVSRKCALSTSFISTRLSQRWCHHGGHRLPEGPRRDFRRSVERSQSPCAAPASTPGRYYPRTPV